jgi:hypothetical protein
LAGDQFTEFEETPENRAGVNAGDYWRQGSGIESSPRVEALSDGMELVRVSDQAGFSNDAPQHFPLYQSGVAGYYDQRQIASGDESTYGSYLHSVKTLLSSADGKQQSYFPIPDMTNGLKPLGSQYAFNPQPHYDFKPLKV